MLKSFVGLFLPHHGNNHRPKILHHPSLLALIGLLFVAQASITLIQTKAPQILGYASQIPAQLIIDLTNQKRQQAGLSRLKTNPQLSDAARRKAANMFAKDYWAHNAPDGTKPWKFILAAGYNYLHAGENLARDFSNAESVVEAWMNSPTHRDNLLSPRYQDIGVAVVDGRLSGTETTLVVQMFGTLLAAKNENTTALVQAASTNTPPTSSVPRSLDEVGPTPTPFPTPTPQVLTGSTPPLFNTYQVTRAVSLAFILLIITVLGLDWLIAWQKGLIRLSGKNWAHLTYLGFILLLIIIIKQGLIL